MRLVRDVIRFEPELEKAVFYAAESTVVCDTLSGAKDLRFGREIFVKAVTLDGTVIAKNGNMTGGSSSADAELARVSRWDERDTREATARKEALLAEEEALRRRTKRGHGADSSSLNVLIEDLETALKNNAARHAGMTKGLETSQELLKKNAAESAACAKQTAEQRRTLAELTSRIEARQDELAALQARVDGAADEVFGSFAARLGLASIREYETAFVERQAADMQARRELSEYLSKLSSKLDYERSVDRSRAVADADKQLAKAKAEVEEHKAAAAEAATAMARIKGTWWSGGREGGWVGSEALPLTPLLQPTNRPPRKPRSRLARQSPRPRQPRTPPLASVKLQSPTGLHCPKRVPRDKPLSTACATSATTSLAASRRRSLRSLSRHLLLPSLRRLTLTNGAGARRALRARARRRLPPQPMRTWRCFRRLLWAGLRTPSSRGTPPRMPTTAASHVSISASSPWIQTT